MEWWYRFLMDVRECSDWLITQLSFMKNEINEVNKNLKNQNYTVDDIILLYDSVESLIKCGMAKSSVENLSFYILVLHLAIYKEKALENFLEDRKLGLAMDEIRNVNEFLEKYNGSDFSNIQEIKIIPKSGKAISIKRPPLLLGVLESLSHQLKEFIKHPKSITSFANWDAIRGKGRRSDFRTFQDVITVVLDDIVKHLYTSTETERTAIVLQCLTILELHKEADGKVVTEEALHKRIQRTNKARK